MADTCTRCTTAMTYSLTAELASIRAPLHAKGDVRRCGCVGAKLASCAQWMTAAASLLNFGFPRTRVLRG